MSTSSTDPIRIELAQPSHRSDILRLVKDVFIAGEPVEAALGLPWSVVGPGWEVTVDDCLAHPHSHVAVAQNGRGIGCRLSRVIDLNTFTNESIYEWCGEGESKDISDSVTKDWRRVLGRAMESCESKKVLQFLVLCVDPAYGKRGIAARMSLENMEYAARELRCSYCTVLATSWISQRLFEKMGFEFLGEIKYGEVMGKNGKALLSNRDPKQAGAKWYGKIL